MNLLSQNPAKSSIISGKSKVQGRLIDGFWSRPRNRQYTIDRTSFSNLHWELKQGLETMLKCFFFGERSWMRRFSSLSYLYDHLSHHPLHANLFEAALSVNMTTMHRSKKRKTELPKNDCNIIYWSFFGKFVFLFHVFELAFEVVVSTEGVATCLNCG